MTKDLTKTNGAPPATIKAWLQSDTLKSEVAKALPRHLTPDRFMRVAMTALTNTPKLAQCDHHSFFKCLLTLSQFGLEPDGRRAHLIPFNNRKRNIMECQLILDYKGIVELVMRSGLVSMLHADVVRETDEFIYDCGEIKTHRPDFHKEDRGPVYAAYAKCVFRDGATKCEVMTLSEINAIRKRSKAKDDGPWVTDWNEMAKKTVFRRLSKWLPLSAEIRDAFEADGDVLEVQAVASAPTSLDSLADMMMTEPEPEPDAETGEVPDDGEGQEEIPL
jgi:recombination protein RecT